MPSYPSALEQAIALAREGAGVGTCVLSAVQDDAVTRMDHRWISPEGGLYLALVVRPKVPMQQLTACAYIAQLATLDALRSLGAAEASLGWPNDLLLGGKKIGCTAAKAGAGEGGLFVVLGVNLNVADAPELSDLARPGDFATMNPQPSTSLAAAGHAVELEELAAVVRACLLARTEAWEHDVQLGRAQAGPLQPFLSEYFDEVSLLGKNACAYYADGREAAKGYFAGLDLWGRITLRTSEGIEEEFAPEQVHLRPEVASKG